MNAPQTTSEDISEPKHFIELVEALKKAKRKLKTKDSTLSKLLTDSLKNLDALHDVLIDQSTKVSTDGTPFEVTDFWQEDDGTINSKKLTITPLQQLDEDQFQKETEESLHEKYENIRKAGQGNASSIQAHYIEKLLAFQICTRDLQKIKAELQNDSSSQGQKALLAVEDLNEKIYDMVSNFCTYAKFHSVSNAEEAKLFAENYPPLKKALSGIDASNYKVIAISNQSAKLMSFVPHGECLGVVADWAENFCLKDFKVRINRNVTKHRFFKTRLKTRYIPNIS